MDDVINMAVILLSIASSSASLGYWLAKQFGKIDARFKEVEARLDAHDTRLAGLETTVKSMDSRLKGVETRLEAHEARLENMEKRLTDVENTVREINTRLGSVENKLTGVETTVKNMDARLRNVESRLAGIEEDVKDIYARLGILETTTKSLQAKLGEVDSKIDGVSTRLDKLEKGIFGFNELLLKVLEEKGVVSRTEALTLLVALRGMIPGSRSKYYTKEVENRLRELLNKDPDTFTMDDIRELEDIAEIMEKEYTVSGRKELLDYAAKLRIGALVFKIVFVEPKMRKLQEWPLSP
ncbi:MULTISPECIES: tropomyosin [Thermofilum]|nr:tropomyosin [Thermofilum adornatum]AJB41724.1 hypothetical protein TCARB_0668 [Thermofilum adornatum 1505]